MIIIKTKFKNLKLIKNKNFVDKRGLLREIYKKKVLKKNIIFDYFSISKKNVVRGLHFQFPQQEKIVTVLKGEILDFSLDLRKNSKTFLRFFKTKLSQQNGISIFIPKGFAHGFVTLKNENIVLYNNSNYYKRDKEISIDFFDKKLKMLEYSKKYFLSNKDKNSLSINQFEKNFKSL